MVNQNEEESFKQLDILKIDKSMSGYTCFCKSFMIFANEREVNVSKSLVLKTFHGINSVEAFLDLGLPIVKYTKPDDILGSQDLTEIYKNKKDENIAFEIDLSQIKRVKRALNLNKLDCYPILWCFQDLTSIKWNVKFEQRIACKYIVIKLMASHKY